MLPNSTVFVEIFRNRCWLRKFPSILSFQRKPEKKECQEPPAAGGGRGGHTPGLCRRPDLRQPASGAVEPAVLSPNTQSWSLCQDPGDQHKPSPMGSRDVHLCYGASSKCPLPNWLLQMSAGVRSVRRSPESVTSSSRLILLSNSKICIFPSSQEDSSPLTSEYFLCPVHGTLFHERQQTHASLPCCIPAVRCEGTSVLCSFPLLCCSVFGHQEP